MTFLETWKYECLTCDLLGSKLGIGKCFINWEFKFIAQLKNSKIIVSDHFSANVKFFEKITSFFNSAPFYSKKHSHLPKIGVAFSSEHKLWPVILFIILLWNLFWQNKWKRITCNYLTITNSLNFSNGTYATGNSSLFYKYRQKVWFIRFYAVFVKFFFLHRLLNKLQFKLGTWSCVTAIFSVQREMMHHIIQVGT